MARAHEAERERLESILQGRTDELTALREQLSLAEEGISERDRYSATLNSTIQQLRAQNVETKLALEGQLREVAAEADRAQLDLANARQEIKDSNSRVDILRESFSDVAQSMRQMTEGISKSAGEDVAEQVEHWKERAQNSARETLAQQRRADECEALEKRNAEQFTQTITRLERSISEQASLVANLRSENASLTNTLSQKDRHITDLRIERDSLFKAKEQLDVKVASGQAERSRADSLAKEVERLLGANEELNQLLGRQAEERGADLFLPEGGSDTKHSDLRQAIRDLEHRFALQTEERSRLQDRLHREALENARLKGQLREAEVLMDVGLDERPTMAQPISNASSDRSSGTPDTGSSITEGVMEFDWDGLFDAVMASDKNMPQQDGVSTPSNQTSHSLPQREDMRKAGPGKRVKLSGSEIVGSREAAPSPGTEREVRRNGSASRRSILKKPDAGHNAEKIEVFAAHAEDPVFMRERATGNAELFGPGSVTRVAAETEVPRPARDGTLAARTEKRQGDGPEEAPASKLVKAAAVDTSAARNGPVGDVGRADEIAVAFREEHQNVDAERSKRVIYSGTLVTQGDDHEASGPKPVPMPAQEDGQQANLRRKTGGRFTTSRQPSVSIPRHSVRQKVIANSAEPRGAGLGGGSQSDVTAGRKEDAAGHRGGHLKEPSLPRRRRSIRFLGV